MASLLFTCPKESTRVKVGATDGDCEAVAAVVVQYIRSRPEPKKSSTPISRLFELPGSNTISVTSWTPWNEAVTATREKVGAADKALALKKSPMKPEGGLEPPQHVPSPDTP